MNENNVISYEYNGDVVRVHLDGEVDEFDFSSMPEGIMKDVKTTLKYNPIMSAKREEGILYLELLYFHGSNASEEERFPTWIDTSEIRVGVYSG